LPGVPCLITHTASVAGGVDLSRYLFCRRYTCCQCQTRSDASIYRQYRYIGSISIISNRIVSAATLSIFRYWHTDTGIDIFRFVTHDNLQMILVIEQK